MKTLLPGMWLKNISVFDLKVGDNVYDKAAERLGVISDIRETTADCIEAFVKFDAESEEIPAYKIKDCLYLGSSESNLE